MERLKQHLAMKDIKGALESFVKQLAEDDAIASQFPRPRLPLSDFDNEGFATREFDNWWELARDVELNEYKGKGLYCTAFDGTQWAEGLIIGKLSRAPYQDKLEVITADGKRAYPPLFVFVWGEDINVYNQRLQNALWERNRAEAMSRLGDYVKWTPTEANPKYPQTLKQEIKENSVPCF